MNTDIKSFEIEDRVVQAVRNFESGYNCAQSVFLAYIGYNRSEFRIG